MERRCEGIKDRSAEKVRGDAVKERRFEWMLCRGGGMILVTEEMEKVEDTEGESILEGGKKNRHIDRQTRGTKTERQTE